VLATVHSSSLLRAPDDETVADLKKVARALR